MADFSQHHSVLPLDSPLLHKMPPLLPHQLEQELTNASNFLLYNPDDATPIQEASLEAPMDCSSSVVLDPHAHGGSVDKKRKSREDNSSFSSAQSKDSKEGKNRRVKKASGGNKEAEESKAKGGEKSIEEEAPKGYIHVRARRGQATDSHSLAERVRRERISERMRMLQALVPGCDKVTGKALILDEIINYVQSLQNQVEFLSMRIASMSPVLYGFGLDSDGLSDQTQKIGGMFQEALPMPSLLNQTSPTPTQAIMDTSTSYSLQGQEAISFSQDNGSYLMQTVVGERRQELLNQVLFGNMCSFQ